MSEHKEPTETGKKLITLADLVDESRPIPQEYRIFQEHNPVLNVSTSTTPFSDYWRLHFSVDRDFEEYFDGEKAKDFFKEHLKQQVLVDLGGGYPGDRSRYFLRDFSNRRMASFAKDYGASTYVNVDTDHPEPIYEQDIEGLHVIDIREDILSFVARMKDGSASFTLNGIWQRSQADTKQWSQDHRYFSALENEIVRATRKGGIIFETDSDVDFSRFVDTEQALLKRVKVNPHSGGNHAFIYERI